MKLTTLKTTVISTLALPAFLTIANPAYATEVIYLCPSPSELHIFHAPGDKDDPHPIKYSAYMKGMVIGGDAKNSATDVKWTTVPLAGRTSDTYLPKTHHEQEAQIKIDRVTLASDKVFCTYKLPGNSFINLGTTSNFPVPFTSCDKTKSATGELGFRCKN